MGLYPKVFLPQRRKDFLQMLQRIYWELIKNVIAMAITRSNLFKINILDYFTAIAIIKKTGFLKVQYDVAVYVYLFNLLQRNDLRSMYIICII